MDKIKILIADENAESRKACREALLRAGNRYVDEVSNGEEALSYIMKNRPDIVIADVWLSKLDGIGVLRNCRSLHFGNDLPPVFIKSDR